MFWKVTLLIVVLALIGFCIWLQRRREYARTLRRMEDLRKQYGP